MDKQTLSPFENSSYFILPLKIDSPEKLAAYLSSKIEWEELPSGFATQYLLFYAGKMNEPADDRFRRYRYADAQMPPIYMFGDRPGGSGKAPTLGDISLYVFGEEIAFLEFQVFYGDMSVDEIALFVNAFRSLRNPKDRPVPSGCLRLEEAADRVLPAGDSGTVLCFSNPSEVKRQANIFTMLGVSGRSDEDCRSICSRLAHGYKTVTTSDGDAVSAYDRCLHLNTNEYWGICPDGLAYINSYGRERPSPYAYATLCADYHFLYLLLLNQRFSAISFIEAFSRFGRNEKADHGITDVYRRVVELRTRYSFRVISDDFFVQTVYGSAYQVLEIESLLNDLEDANGQFNELSKEREKRIERIVGAVSVMAAFSALVDLADYLGMFRIPQTHWISLAVILAIIAGAVAWIFGRRDG